MSPSARMDDFNALEALKAAFTRASGDVQNALSTAETEANKTLNQLQVQLNRWQSELQRRQEALRRAEAALKACTAQVSRDSKTGHTSSPDCRAQQEAVRQAVRRVEEAKKKVEVLREHINKVKSASERLKGHVRPLLNHDLPEAIKFLNTSLARLWPYVSGDVMSNGGSGWEVTNTASKSLVDEYLQDAHDIKTNKSRQFSKQGGFEQANKDFDILAGSSPIKDHGGGIRSAMLQDGTTISVRPSSSGGYPTIQINPLQGKPIKVRYE